MCTFDASGEVDKIKLMVPKNELTDGIESPASAGNQIRELWPGLALMRTTTTMSAASGVSLQRLEGRKLDD